MRIARTAATLALALVLVAAGCGRSGITEPDSKRPRSTTLTPELLVPDVEPRKGGNGIGSGY